MASQFDGRIPALPARQARSNHVTVRVQLKVTHPSNAGELVLSKIYNNNVKPLNDYPQSDVLVIALNAYYSSRGGKGKSQNWQFVTHAKE